LKTIFLLLLPFLTFAQPRYVEWGASLGYPADLKAYDGAIESAVTHGITSFRIYDPFIKSYDTNVTRTADLIAYLINTKGAKRVLLSISNSSYTTLKADTTGSNLTVLQKKKTDFNNCDYPKDTTAYKALLRRLFDKLQATPRYFRGFPTGSVMDLVEVEFGNEPDSEIHYWGTFEQFKTLAQIKYDVAKNYTSKIYCCDFTMSLLRDSAYKNKGQWMKWIETDPFFNKAKLSNSFYWKTDSAVKGAAFDFNVNDNDWPKRNFTGQIISEYNLYTSFDNGSARDSIFNSRMYGVKLCEFLAFIYNKKAITTVYIHPLAEVGYGEGGNMGIWKKAYPKGYDPKPAVQMLYDIISAIKDGYTIAPGKIICKRKTIYYTSYNYAIILN
jgi:hypothetical protein